MMRRVLNTVKMDGVGLPVPALCAAGSHAVTLRAVLHDSHEARCAGASGVCLGRRRGRHRRGREGRGELLGFRCIAVVWVQGWG